MLVKKRLLKLFHLNDYALLENKFGSIALRRQGLEGVPCAQNKLRTNGDRIGCKFIKVYSLSGRSAFDLKII